MKRWGPMEQVPFPPRQTPTRLSLLHRLLRHLPGFCSYCGRRYQPKTHELAHGRFCPDAHEGYLDSYSYAGRFRVWYDFVECRTSPPFESVWTCKDGRQIPIAKLTDEHLTNIVRFLWRNVEEYRRGLVPSQPCLLYQGDPNVVEFASSLDDDEVLTKAIRQWVTLKTEVVKRGLRID